MPAGFDGVLKEYGKENFDGDFNKTFSENKKISDLLEKVKNFVGLIN